MKTKFKSTIAGSTSLGQGVKLNDTGASGWIVAFSWQVLLAQAWQAQSYLALQWRSARQRPATWSWSTGCLPTAPAGPRSSPGCRRPGINATSVQNPLTTLEESVAAAQRALALQDGPTVLVGHSFSGMIVTEAGVDPKVTALVYVAARAPDAGEDYTALAKSFPTPPASAGIVWSGDYGQLSEAAFLRDFAGDLPAAKARVLYAVQGPFTRALLAGKTTHAAWRSKPSWYAVSTEDRTINPDLERFMAKRMGATTIEVKASHLSLISPARHDREADPGGRRTDLGQRRGRSSAQDVMFRSRSFDAWYKFRNVARDSQSVNAKARRWSYRSATVRTGRRGVAAREINKIPDRDP